MTDPHDIPAELPIGGSTGLDHGDNAAIDEATAWLLATPDRARPRPLVPHLRAAFGLGARDACIAIGEAQRRRAAAYAADSQAAGGAQ